MTLRLHAPSDEIRRLKAVAASQSSGASKAALARLFDIVHRQLAAEVRARKDQEREAQRGEPL